MEISQSQADKIAYYVYENYNSYVDEHIMEFQQYLKELGKPYKCFIPAKFSYMVFPIFICYSIN